MPTQLVKRFPEFDNQLFPLLNEANIFFTQDEYDAFLQHPKPWNVLSAITSLQKAGILTREKLYQCIDAKEKIIPISFIFSLLQENNLLAANFNSAMQCNDLHSLSTIVVALNRQSPTILTQENLNAILRYKNGRADLSILSTALNFLNACVILSPANFEATLSHHNPALITDTLEWILKTRQNQEKLLDNFSRLLSANLLSITVVEEFKRSTNTTVYVDDLLEDKKNLDSEGILTASTLLFLTSLDICSRGELVYAKNSLSKKELLTLATLKVFKEHQNPLQFSEELKTAQSIVKEYRDDRKKGYWSSSDSKAIVRAFETFSITGDYSLFRSATNGKTPGARLKTILATEDYAEAVNRMDPAFK